MTTNFFFKPMVNTEKYYVNSCVTILMYSQNGINTNKNKI